EGPVDLRIGTLDGARLLRGHVERDANGAVIRDLQVVAYRQDRAEVRVTRLGQFWVAAPGSGDWALAEVRDLSASGAALVLQEALPLVRVRGEINTDYGHEVTFESAARLVRVAEETVAGIVAVYEFDLDDSQRCALRAAVLWHTSAKRA
ncbi:MAG: hypothetical protein JWL70_3176, partial [Acidimicrobiia bacterium]|nr:hypothetical protein [Acidimicrobiia bacterium]